jgi:hypothetical protein
MENPYERLSSRSALPSLLDASHGKSYRNAMEISIQKAAASLGRQPHDENPIGAPWKFHRDKGAVAMASPWHDLGRGYAFKIKHL